MISAAVLNSAYRNARDADIRERILLITRVRLDKNEASGVAEKELVGIVTDNASFHVSRKTKQFIENQLHWLTVIFLPKRSPNLNPVETRINRNLKKDICANHSFVA